MLYIYYFINFLTNKLHVVCGIMFLNC